MAEERVERRLAAILAADVAGYSRLMSEDEAGTLAAWQRCHSELIDPCIARGERPGDSCTADCGYELPPSDADRH
jgi:class 3 adenylate cyclase